MILKASQRAGAKQLALHLLSSHDNEHVELHELRGFVANDLQGALHETYAISRATKCKQYMFSLSLNPPENANVPVENFESALEKVEKKLGLSGQARAVVFHEKEGRRHCHCVWSRIQLADDGKLKAVQLPHFKRKLNDVARDLYLEHGWDMPAGFKNKLHRDPRNFTLAEWQQAKRHNQDPRMIKQAIQECWAHSDNQAAFKHALNDAGFMLARGDRRNTHVAVDWFGEVYSIGRATGIKAKAVQERLGKADTLPSVAQVKAKMSHTLKTQHREFLTKLNAHYAKAQKPLKLKKAKLLQLQKQDRNAQQQAHQKRHVQERQTRQSRFRTGLRGLWDRLSGRAKATRKQNEAEFIACQQRDKAEKQTLIAKQLSQRQTLQMRIKKQRAVWRENVAKLNAGFMQVLQGHQSLEDLKTSFARATTKDVPPEFGRSHSNDNKPEIGL